MVSLGAFGLFGVSAFWSEWAVGAERVGLVGIPVRGVSVATWTAVVTLLAAVIVLRNPEVVHLRHSPWAAGVVLYASSIGFGVMIAIARTASLAGVSEGLQDVLVALAPIPLAILVGRRWQAAAAIALALLGLELLYCAGQLLALPLDQHVTGWLTVGNASRWWDSRALFGTFATTGKNFFGSAMALSAAVLLPWTLGHSSRITRATAIVLVCLTAIAVALSLSRGALVSLIASALVIAASVGTRRRALAVACGTIAVLLAISLILALQGTSLKSLKGSASSAESGSVRLEIWRAALGSGPSLLVGQGHDRAHVVTSTVQETFHQQPGLGASNATENLYIRRLVEGGLIGVAGLLGYFAALAFESRGIRRQQRLDTQTLWRLSLRALVAAVVVQSLFADVLAYEQAAAVFAISVGLAGATLHSGGAAFPTIAKDERRLRCRDQDLPK